MARLEDVIQIGTVAGQPAATAVPIGTLYSQTDGTPANNVQRSNGTTWDDYAPTSGGGGGGNAIDSTAVGSEPGSPATGDVDLYSNGIGVARYSGTAWVPWGPLYPLIDPNLQTFAWVNQGGASVDSTNGGIYLLAPGNAGTSIRSRVKSISNTTSGDLQLAILPLLFDPSGNSGCGMVLRESATGKLEFFRTILTTSGVVTYISYASDNTTLVANDVTAALIYPPTPQFLRCVISGSNYLFSVSADGQHWIQVLSLAKTTHFTIAADQWGIAANSQDSGAPAALTLLSWKET